MCSCLEMLQIVAVLHAFGSVLRFHHLLLFHAAAVVCSCPGMWRLGGMGAGEVLRLVGAFAATRHYEGRLLRAAVRVWRAEVVGDGRCRVRGCVMDAAFTRG